MKIKYDDFNGKDAINDELKELFGPYIGEKLEFASNVRVSTVRFPFILPDNLLDLREANNITE